MTIKQFIKKHKESLDVYIQHKAPGSPKTNNERELWIMNDETLYNWFRAERRER